MPLILVADDETEVREALAAAFKSKGNEVISYSDGQSALDHARLKKPDLIVLDVMMPKMNGWEACRAIKNDEKTKGIPVIILTSKSKEIDELMSAESGADLYMQKPFSPAEVLKEGERLMGGKQ